MNYKLKLVNEKIGFELEQVTHYYKQAKKLAVRWKHSYGKKFMECTFYCNGYEVDKETLHLPTTREPIGLTRNIVNLKTKDIYTSEEEACQELKISKDCKS